MPTTTKLKAMTAPDIEAPEEMATTYTAYKPTLKITATDSSSMNIKANGVFKHLMEYVLQTMF